MNNLINVSALTKLPGKSKPDTSTKVYTTTCPQCGKEHREHYMAGGYIEKHGCRWNWTCECGQRNVSVMRGKK